MSAEQLAAQLQRAAAAQTQRKRADALAELRGCANLEPPQLPCESRLALVLAEDRARPAEMEYYLTAAIRGEPSPLTAADYEALGRTASRKGLHELAVIAFDKRLALKEDGQGYALLGEALQGIPARMEDAIDALAKAQTLEPTRTQLSLDRATLLHQRGRFKEAAEALVYVAERESDATKRASLLAQVKKLRSSAEAAGSAH